MRIDDELDIVRFALALHRGADPDSIAAPQRLKEDLGLDPLDLVLVALRLEELAGGEFPVAELAWVRTVADLVDLVRAWSMVDPADRRSTLPPLPESGVRLGARAAARAAS